MANEKYVEKIKSASTGVIYTIRDQDTASKQDILVSGENIKTINNQSILGSGNIEIQGGSGAVDSVNGKTGAVVLNASDVGAASTGDLAAKQDKLTSDNAGSNVTITEVSGVLKINATGSGGTSDYDALLNKPAIDNHELDKNSTAASLGLATSSDLSNKQDTLVSGTNIKTINNTSLLGSGNVEVLTSSDVGTMAAENKTDYYTKTEVADEFLPASEAITITETSVEISTLDYNKVYTCTNPITSLTITAFGASNTNLETVLYFTTDTTFTMTLPVGTKYSPMQPVMRPETSYVMSVVNGVVVIGTIE